MEGGEGGREGMIYIYNFFGMIGKGRFDTSVLIQNI